ncbi:putative leucine-rich repeat-containing protein DDB_G0290503 isoform X2 [Anopheles maculipalpis]|uniref:putative leucine-rich repeat-containing protein DDB_G0290503 isoform X2 n=1 Tax=Anopheles maculipalpis TaxID=1496333 RepID=UPI002159858E|nr:putative leucine-rich repeat-containing protein DDB_G0290503 isoform X2 [Anopheles maculipalpis]
MIIILCSDHPDQQQTQQHQQQQQQHHHQLVSQQIDSYSSPVCLMSADKGSHIVGSKDGSSSISGSSSSSGVSSISGSPSFHTIGGNNVSNGSSNSNTHKHRSTVQRNSVVKNIQRKVDTSQHNSSSLTKANEKQQNVSLSALIGHAKPSPQHDDITKKVACNDDGVPVDDNEFMNHPNRTLKLERSDLLVDTAAETSVLDDSSDREVSPKFVVGTKKYGRRSRPRDDVNGLDSSSLSSNSDNESVIVKQPMEKEDGPRQSFIAAPVGGTVASSKVQRSASQSDIHGSKRRRPVVGGGAGVHRLKRCASLPTHRQRPATVESKRNTTTTTTITIREQLHMDDERIDQKIYFMNLSENLREIWNSLLLDSDRRHGDLLNQAQLEEVCERVGLQKVPARLAAQEVFNKLSLQPSEGIGFEEFIALLESNTDLLPMNETKELQVDDCGGGGGGPHSGCPTAVVTAEESTFTLALPPDWTSEIGSLAASIIIDMWESEGIETPANLLHELGFNRDVIHVADLVQALEEEHQRLVSGHLNSSTISNISSSLFDDAALIVRASLVLHKAEVTALRQAFHQLVEENKKLYADNKEVNHRAVLLAQEVDERHNSLENSTRTKIRHLEQRHHETVKELTSQLTFEREQLSHANGLLEKRIQSLENEEGKLKAEMSRMAEENEELRQDQENLTKEITDLLEKNIKLNRDIAELEENNRNDYADDDECGFVRKDSEEVLDLIDRISLLQNENTGLRDKNDELSAEIEMLSVELGKFKLKRCTVVSDDLSTSCGVDGTAGGSAAIKRRGDSPSKTRLSDESPRLGKFRRCSNENDIESDSSSGDWMALHSELGQSIRCSSEDPAVGGVVVPGCVELTGTSSGISSMNESSLNRDDEIKALRMRIEELEGQLKDAKKNVVLVVSPTNEEMSSQDASSPSKKDDEGEESKKLKARCDELESSLEQMRKEYEDCEDYWQAKVNDERLLYEEEQRINDEKFTELLKKVAEYEEQFAGNSKLEKDGRLSPIDEKDGLEQQYLELEADFEQAQMALEERTAEVEKLRRKILDMEQMHKYPSEMLLSPSPRVETPEVEDRPASSPISYLWNQSTIQRPVRDYQNPNWRPPVVVNTISRESGASTEDKCSVTVMATVLNSSIPQDGNECTDSCTDEVTELGASSFDRVISPIQKPTNGESCEAKEIEDTTQHCTTVVVLDQIDASDACSVKSARSTQSLASTHSIQHSIANSEGSASGMQAKHMRLVQLQLQDEIKDLTHERDCLMMELQQLKEAKSVLARSYAKTASHPNQMQKIQNLEQKNRHLQLMVKQQQQYTESILHQIWQQQRSEINDLRNRLEAQCTVISDQAARLANNDILVKDMYAENSQLMLQVQRLEHQYNRANWMQQYSSQSNSSSGSHHGLSGIMPGLP